MVENHNVRIERRLGPGCWSPRYVLFGSHEFDFDYIFGNVTNDEEIANNLCSNVLDTNNNDIIDYDDLQTLLTSENDLSYLTCVDGLESGKMCSTDEDCPGYDIPNFFNFTRYTSSLIIILFTLLINSGAIACLAAFLRDLTSVFRDPDFKSKSSLRPFNRPIY